MKKTKSQKLFLEQITAFKYKKKSFENKIMNQKTQQQSQQPALQPSNKVCLFKKKSNIKEPNFNFNDS